MNIYCARCGSLTCGKYGDLCTSCEREGKTESEITPRAASAMLIGITFVSLLLRSPVLQQLVLDRKGAAKRMEEARESFAKADKITPP